MSSENLNSLETLPSELLHRLQAASHALPVKETLQSIADDVYEWDSEGLSAREIDRRIVEWMDENGHGYSEWESEWEDYQSTSMPPGVVLDPRKLWKAFGYEEWYKDCIRSIAFTGEPIPFMPLAAGYWIEEPNADPPLLIAVITPLSDPKLAAKQLVEKHRKHFGDKAARSSRKDEVENARMMQRHREGMSYKEIAIQNLRERYPDIVARPSKYKDTLNRERERVAKCVRAAEELWKERLPDSSIEE